MRAERAHLHALALHQASVSDRNPSTVDGGQRAMPGHVLEARGGDRGDALVLCAL
jgi:hypothetical protein